MAAVLGIIVVGLAVATLVLRRELAPIILARASSAVNGKVNLRRATITAGGVVVLEGVSVTAPDETRPVVSAPRVLVYPSFFPRRRVTIELESPTLNALRGPKGDLNVLKIIKPTEKPGKWDVDVKASHLTIYVHDRAGIPNDVYAPYLLPDRKSVKPEKRAAYADLVRTLTQAGLPPEREVPPPKRPFHFEAKLTEGNLDLNYSASDVSLIGSVSARLPDGGYIELRSHKMRNLGKSLKTLNIEYSLGLTVAGARFKTFGPYLNSYLPFLAQARLDGDVVRFKEDFSQDAKKRVEYSFDITAEKCTATLNKTVHLTDLGGAVSYTTRGLVLKHDLSANIDGNPITANGEERFGERTLDLRASSKGIPLMALAPYLDGASLNRVTGLLDFYLRASGKFGEPRANGTVGVRGLALAKQPLGDAKADFYLTPSGGKVTRLSLVGPAYSLEGRGTLSSLSAGAVSFSANVRDLAKLPFQSGRKGGDLSGSATVTGDITFSAGAYRLAASVASPRLIVVGRQVDTVKASLTLNRQELVVNSLTALIPIAGQSGKQTKPPIGIDASGRVEAPFSSKSPLALAGNATWRDSADSVSASFTGAGTPSQLSLKGDYAGKLSGRDLSGTMYAQATKGGAGGTLTGKLAGASATVNFTSDASGMKGTLSASGVNPSAIWPDSGVDAEASVSASFSTAGGRPTFSGTFAAPTVKLAGAEDAPIENLSSDASYAGGKFALKRFKATALGNEISLAGNISKNSIGVAGGQEKFNVAGVKDSLKRSGEWDGGGPLRIAAKGTPDAPDIRLTLLVGKGHAEGAAFDFASVDVQVKRPSAGAPIRIDVNDASVTSGRGRLSMKGTMAAGKDGRAALTAVATSFPAAILAPFAHVSPDAHLTGTVNATVAVGGTVESLSPSGRVVVTDASVYDTPIQQATLEFSAEGDATRIDSFEAYNEDTIVRASGVISRDPAKTLLNVEAPSINLELFTPFLKQYPKLAGNAEVQVRVTTEGGEPHMVGSLIVNNASFGGLKFRSVLGRFTFGGQVLELSDMTLKPEPLPGREEETVVLNGTMPLAEDNAPIDFRVRAARLDASYLALIFPKSRLNVGGVLSTDLGVTGTRRHPLLNGTVGLSSGSSSFSYIFGVQNVTGTLRFSDNKFTVENVRIGGGAPVAKGGKGEPPPPSNLVVTGGGEVTFSPFRVLDAKITIHMQGVENVVLASLYSGAVDGDLVLDKLPGDSGFTLKGVVVLKSGGIINLAAPIEEVMSLRGPVAFDVSVSIPEPVETRYRPIDLRAYIFGQFHMTGTPGDVHLDGSVLADEGSLLLFSHVLRLTERTTISFTSVAGVIPFIRGRAAVVLPSAILEPAAVGGEVRKDLTVYFDFNDLATNLDSVRLSSDPPRSPEFIRQALGGQIFSPGLTAPLTQQVREQIVTYSTERLSRLLEESLKLERLDVHLVGQSTLVVNVEKKVQKNLVVTYSRNFFTDINRQEVFGIKYKIGTRMHLNGYVEFRFDRAEPSRIGQEVNIQVTRRF